MTKYRVNAGYVMIERAKVDAHGLLLPYDKREISRGRVLGVGTIRSQKGEKILSGIKPGDLVQYEPFVGYEYGDYLFIPYEYVYGVVTND